MRTFSVGLAASIALLFVPALAPLAEAQATASAPPAADSAMVRGTVIARESNVALPYAVVSIPSLGIQQFTNDRGRFVLPKLPNGTYRLRARQLGYSPVDADVKVAGDSTAEITIRMTRIALQLATMRVETDWPCDMPGRAQLAGNARVLEVFEQMEQNAERLRIMSDQYPFLVSSERRQVLRRRDGSESPPQIDTTVATSLVHENYKPGKVVERRRDKVGVEYYMRIPTLLDFADEEFRNNHCFLVRGVDNGSGTGQLRIDFKTWSKITTPDVEGSVFLDTANYRLRRVEVRLTRVPPQLTSTANVTVTTHFHELRPGLPIVGTVHAVTELKRMRSSQFAQGIEDQTTFLVRFLKQRPDSIDGPRNPPR